MTDVTDDGGFLSADDARILALESSVLTGHTLKLMILAPGEPLDLDALRASVLGRLDAEPRALQCVEGGGAGEPARWVTADDFDIADHVRRRAGTECATPEDLRRTVSTLVSEHLDRRRPLWTFDLIGPLADGSEAIAARMHHAMVDGIAGMQFLEVTLLDPHDGPAPAARTSGAGPSAAAAANAPASYAHEWARLASVVGRELGRPGSRSPFDRPVTGARDVAFTIAPLSGLKAIGASRAERATVNDVLLAVVAGGLSTWLDTHGARLDLRAQVPVSLHHRQEDAATAGNHDSFMNVDLELGASDPLHRLDRISARTRTEKQAGDAALLYDLFHALGAVPAVDAFAHRIAESSREFSLAISNVPGPRVPVAV